MEKTDSNAIDTRGKKKGITQEHGRELGKIGSPDLLSVKVPFLEVVSWGSIQGWQGGEKS